jgi:hypothetical protein
MVLWRSDSLSLCHCLIAFFFYFVVASACYGCNTFTSSFLPLNRQPASVEERTASEQDTRTAIVAVLVLTYYYDDLMQRRP